MGASQKENIEMIVITRGVHSHPIPKGLKGLVGEVLAEVGVPKELNWKIQFGKNVKGTAHTPRFKVKGLGPEDSFIELYLKPGNNTTAHICQLKAENGNKTDLKSLHDTLKEWEEAKGLKKPSTNGSANGHSSVQLEPAEKTKTKPEAQTLGEEKEKVVVKKSKSALIGFADDPEQVCIFLLELDRENKNPDGWISRGKCRDALARVVGSGFSKRALGATITSMFRKGYLCTDGNKNGRPTQYFRVSGKGRRVIFEAEGIKVTKLPPNQKEAVTVSSKTTSSPKKKSEGRKTKPSASELALEADLKELESQIEENRQQMVLLENRFDTVQKALKILRGLE